MLSSLDGRRFWPFSGSTGLYRVLPSFRSTGVHIKSGQNKVTVSTNKNNSDDVDGTGLLMTLKLGKIRKFVQKHYSGKKEKSVKLK